MTSEIVDVKVDQENDFGKNYTDFNPQDAVEKIQDNITSQEKLDSFLDEMGKDYNAWNDEDFVGAYRALSDAYVDVKENSYCENELETVMKVADYLGVEIDQEKLEGIYGIAFYDLNYVVISTDQTEEKAVGTVLHELGELLIKPSKWKVYGAEEFGEKHGLTEYLSIVIANEQHSPEVAYNQIDVNVSKTIGKSIEDEFGKAFENSVKNNYLDEFDPEDFSQYILD